MVLWVPVHPGLTRALNSVHYHNATVSQMKCSTNDMWSYLYSFFKGLWEEFIAVFNSNVILPWWIDPGRRDLEDIKWQCKTLKKYKHRSNALVEYRLRKWVIQIQWKKSLYMTSDVVHCTCYFEHFLCNSCYLFNFIAVWYKCLYWP